MISVRVVLVVVFCLVVILLLFQMLGAGGLTVPKLAQAQTTQQDDGCVGYVIKPDGRKECLAR
jgi:hypothetical protein